MRGERVLFSNLSFSVAPGTLLQIQGPNGSGKTSLLRIICGLMEPAGGEVRWRGEKISLLDDDYAAAIAYLGHRNGIKEELTPFENLRISSGLAGDSVTTEEVSSALDMVGLGARKNLPARFLSEGQKRRSALARLITSKAKLWILDEALAALDSAGAALVSSLTATHLGKGGMALVATHQALQLSSGSVEQLHLSGPVGAVEGALAHLS